MHRRIVFVCLWSMLAGLAVCMHGPALFRCLAPSDEVPVDFFQEWASARNFYEGRPIYTPHAVTVPAYLDVEHKRDRVDRNAHPPVSVLFALPFGLLDYPRALKLWNMLSLAALYLAVRITFQHQPIPSSRWGRALLPVAVVCFFSFPMQQHLENGQWTLIIALLLVLVWRADAAGRDGLAGAWLGLATALKLFPGLLVVYFAAQRQWRTLLHAALCFVAVSVLAVLVLGVDAQRDFLNHALPGVADWRSHPSNNSLPALWAKLFDPGDKEPTAPPLVHAPMLATAGSAASRLAIVAILAVLSVRARSSAQRDLAYWIIVTAMLLVSPVTWHHYLVLPGVGMLVLWRHLPVESRARLLAAACLLACWLHPRYPWRVGSWLGFVDDSNTLTTLQLLTLSSLPLYALLVLFGMSIVAWRRAVPEAQTAHLPESPRRAA